jgi:hypothetical protein
MNHQNNRALAKWRTVPIPPSCGAQKATASAINPNIDQESELKLVVAYDDFRSGIRARNLFERLSERFSKIIAFIPRFLKFEQLAKPCASEREPGEAAAVDIIVIVADEHVDLHDLAEDWMRTWKMTRRTAGRRLLALFSACHEENDRRHQTQSRLQQVARRTGMRFDLRTPPMPRMIRRVAEATPRALQRLDECGGKLRNLCETSRSLSSTPRRAAAAETPVDPQMTAVSNAIIEVLRSRQRKASAPIIPLTNGKRMRAPETNQIPNSSKL